ncbi:MAG TPA: hypothetical protein VFB14_10630 [Bryobacteraceae bacterium]|nr:hypothetical protein [Bryobacteraceae bacterium]
MYPERSSAQYRRTPNGLPLRQRELYPAERLDMPADGLRQILRSRLFRDEYTLKNLARLLLHGTPVMSGTYS